MQPEASKELSLSEFLSAVEFDSQGLVPVIAQDAETKEVLMLAYMNSEAIEKTHRSGRACYWSRSRSKYWFKGESSGNHQFVKEMRLDCDGDTILLSVEQLGPACHTGSRTCFFTVLLSDLTVS